MGQTIEKRQENESLHIHYVQMELVDRAHLLSMIYLLRQTIGPIRSRYVNQARRTTCTKYIRHFERVVCVRASSSMVADRKVVVS